MEDIQLFSHLGTADNELVRPPNGLLSILSAILIFKYSMKNNLSTGSYQAAESSNSVVLKVDTRLHPPQKKNN